MSNDDSLPVALQAIEARLTSLTPAPARLDRDRLMYAAGQVAVQSRPCGGEPVALRGLRGWKAATLTLAASAAALAFLAAHAYLTRPAVERVFVYVNEGRDSPLLTATFGDRNAAADSTSRPDLPPRTWPSIALVTRATAADSYVHQRNVALLHGTDALPLQRASAISPSSTPTTDELLEELIEGPQFNDQKPTPRDPNLDSAIRDSK